MLPLQLQPRRLILLTVLMIAALMMMNKTLLPNQMHPKTPSCITKTKNNLEKMRRTKCLTRYSYDDKKITLKNSKKNLEKIKRTKCLTSYIIKKESKKDIKKRRKTDSKNSKKNLEKMKRTKCLTSFVIKNVKEKDELKTPRMFDLGLGVNRYARMVNGNGRSSYNIALWNCRKGLLDADNNASEKMTEVKNFLSDQKLHLLCLVESELHGLQSRVRRRLPLTESQIKSSLAVDGYKIILPQTWYVHGQARIALYVKEDVRVTVIPVARQHTDLPTLTCTLGVGKGKKTIVNFFYREWTSSVSGMVGAEARKRD